MKDIQLRWAFVSMLFALAIARAAELIGQLVQIAGSDWQDHLSLQGLGTTDSFLLWAPATHLFLGILLVATSWVGWAQSGAPGNKKEVEKVLSWQFVLLLIEVSIVILYFILISAVELDFQAFKASNYPHYVIPNPSAGPEAKWIAFVFFAYFLWDIVADVILGPIPNKYRPIQTHPIISSITCFCTGVITCGFTSFACCTLSIIVQYFGSQSTSALSAITGDLALICLVFWFRIGKVSELLFIKVFTWEAQRPGSKKPRCKTRTYKWRRAFYENIPLLIVFFIFLQLI